MEARSAVMRDLVYQLERLTPDSASLHPGYGRQLILCSGAPEIGFASAPVTAKPCFS
jgi:hypothetical protein